MKKTSQAQINASLNYQNKALERVSQLIISPHEQEIFDALQVIKAHYGGNRAKAIKQAILAHAKQLAE
ncbi:hypothetical protein [Moraxella marmotae]|uniref:hypothetical protein n=1 Tax=Moraxella marmotae TaxID=3344520 RepID=UPI0035F4BC79